jgi:hypothetical protein
MTTEIHKIHNPRLPEPSAYTRYLERQVARQEAECRRQRRKERIEMAAIGVAITVVIWGLVMLWRVLP